MMKHSKIKALLALFLSFDLWLIFDFFTKRWAVSESFHPFTFIESWFYLVPFHKNDGIAFGLDIPFVIQILASLLIIAFLLWMGIRYLFELKGPATFQAILLGMILGGGVGNLIDRLAQGYVVDFIILKPIPTFNIADVGITVGLLLLFVTMLVEEKD